MFSRLFPKQLDNNYQGYWLAIWLLIPLVLVKLIMGLNVAGLNPWVSSIEVMKTADGVPLDTFGTQAASTLVFMFASWGLGLLLLSLLATVALVRYRAMVPLMYLVLTLEQVGRKGLALIHPIVKSVEAAGISPAFFINWGLSAALVIGLVLSLSPRTERTKAQESAT